MSPVSLWHEKQKNLTHKQIPQQLYKEPLWTKAFISIWVLNFLMCGWAFMINATFPFYVKGLGGSELLVGITAGGYALCCLFTRPLAGWVLDHKGRRGLLQGGLVCMALLSILYLLAPGLGVLVALRQLNGFIYAGSGTASNTTACDIVAPTRFAEGIGLLGLSNTLATALGPACGLLIMEKLGFNTLYALTIVLVLLAWPLARAISYKNVHPRAYLPGRYHLRWAELFNKAAIPASLVALLTVLPYGGVNVFVALYGEYSGLGQGGLFFILVALGSASMRLFAGRMADKNGEGLNIILGNSAFFCGALLLIFANSHCYYFSGLLLGCGFGLATPAMQSMAIRIVPTENRGSASGTFLCAFDIGIGLGGLVAGWLVTTWGYRPMFAILSVFAILSTLVYVFWAAKTPSAFKVYMRNQAALQEVCHGQS